MSNPSKLTPVQVKSLNLLCRTLASDKSLRRWFASLETLPSNLRANAIMQISSEMRRNDEDLSIIGAICSLSDSDVYEAAKEAVADLIR